jgi:hypothetical protein
MMSVGVTADSDFVRMKGASYKLIERRKARDASGHYHRWESQCAFPYQAAVEC